MAKVIQPSDPLRADYRKIRDVLRSTGKNDKVLHLPEEYEKVVSVFEGLGGNWEELFKGSVRHLKLLKNVVKKAVKMKILSPAPSWDGKVTTDE